MAGDDGAVRVVLAHEAERGLLHRDRGRARGVVVLAVAHVVVVELHRDDGVGAVGDDARHVGALVRIRGQVVDARDVAEAVGEGEAHLRQIDERIVGRNAPNDRPAERAVAVERNLLPRARRRELHRGRIDAARFVAQLELDRHVARSEQQPVPHALGGADSHASRHGGHAVDNERLQVATVRPSRDEHRDHALVRRSRRVGRPVRAVRLQAQARLVHAVDGGDVAEAHGHGPTGVVGGQSVVHQHEHRRNGSLLLGRHRVVALAQRVEVLVDDAHDGRARPVEARHAIGIVLVGQRHLRPGRGDRDARQPRVERVALPVSEGGQRHARAIARDIDDGDVQLPGIVGLDGLEREREPEALLAAIGPLQLHLRQLVADERIASVFERRRRQARRRIGARYVHLHAGRVQLRGEEGAAGYARRAVACWVAVVEPHDRQAHDLAFHDSSFVGRAFAVHGVLGGARVNRSRVRSGVRRIGKLDAVRVGVERVGRGGRIVLCRHDEGERTGRIGGVEAQAGVRPENGIASRVRHASGNLVVVQTFDAHAVEQPAFHRARLRRQRGQVAAVQRRLPRIHEGAPSDVRAIDRPARRRVRRALAQREDLPVDEQRGEGIVIERGAAFARKDVLPVEIGFDVDAVGYLQIAHVVFERHRKRLGRRARRAGAGVRAGVWSGIGLGVRHPASRIREACGSRRARRPPSRKDAEGVGEGGQRREAREHRGQRKAERGSRAGKLRLLRRRLRQKRRRRLAVARRRGWSLREQRRRRPVFVVDQKGGCSFAVVEPRTARGALVLLDGERVERPGRHALPPAEPLDGGRRRPLAGFGARPYLGDGASGGPAGQVVAYVPDMQREEHDRRDRREHGGEGESHNGYDGVRLAHAHATVLASTYAFSILPRASFAPSTISACCTSSFSVVGSTRSAFASAVSSRASISPCPMPSARNLRA